MKVNTEEIADRFGVIPFCRVSGKDANPQNVKEWLYRNFGQGYKFVMVFDCMSDEFEEPEKETPVYYMDDVGEEILEYIGVERVKEWLRKKCDEMKNERVVDDVFDYNNAMKEVWKHCRSVEDCNGCQFYLDCPLDELHVSDRAFVKYCYEELQKGGR